MGAAVRLAVVTGASRGIGEAVARRLAAGGWRVLGSVRREDDAERLRAAGILPVVADVTDAGDVRRLAAAAGDAGAGRVEALVNNAGITGGGPLEGAGEGARAVVETNLVGPMLVTAELLPMLRAAPGRIVNIGSSSAVLATPFLAAYAASKAGLEVWSIALRRELAPFGVGVTLLRVGPVRTAIWSAAHDVPASALDRQPYGAALRRFVRLVQRSEAHGRDPAVVAEAVASALEARRAPARRLVAADPLQSLAVRLLPARLLDRLVIRAVHGPGITPP
jgi:NAD(P)-dependent dehydrogenase (short-subunit alcohol dehydrogenase family)